MTSDDGGLVLGAPDERLGEGGEGLLLLRLKERLRLFSLTAEGKGGHSVRVGDIVRGNWG